MSERNGFSKTTSNNSMSQNRNYNTKNNSYSTSSKNSYDDREDDRYMSSDADNEIESDIFLEKLETKKRLEREKTIKKKKDLDEDNTVKMKRSHGKPKKMKNINWTRGYQNGLFDDDDFYDEYMR